MVVFYFILFHFIYFILLFRAAPAAYGNSQAESLIGAVYTTATVTATQDS